ncbi:MAG: hypothetical protein DMF69_02665, partial [Acidobacteria bacterium]
VGRGTGTDFNPPPYQPPGYQQPGEKRRTWPWLVGIFGVLLLLLIGASIAAAIFIPRFLKKSRESIAVKNENTNQPATSNSNTNSNSVVESTPETNSNTNATVNTPAPSDKELVLTQLKDLEQEWTVANLNADKKKLGQILGDDYVSPRADGKMQGKAEYIRTIERDASVQNWEFRDLRLTLRGDRAILFGKVTFHLANGDVVYDFVDRFVWRDGRWQATGSEITQVKN